MFPLAICLHAIVGEAKALSVDVDCR